MIPTVSKGQKGSWSLNQSRAMTDLSTGTETLELSLLSQAEGKALAKYIRSFYSTY